MLPAHHAPWNYPAKCTIPGPKIPKFHDWHGITGYPVWYGRCLSSRRDCHDPRPGASLEGYRVREALNKSHLSRVAEKIKVVARSATQVVAKPATPRSAPKRALDFEMPRNCASLRFHATLEGRGFAGDPLCLGQAKRMTIRCAKQVSSRKTDRRGHARLVRGFLSIRGR